MKIPMIDGYPERIKLPVHIVMDKNGQQCIVDSDNYFICKVSRYWENQLVNLINVNQVNKFH